MYFTLFDDGVCDVILKKEISKRYTFCHCLGV